MILILAAIRFVNRKLTKLPPFPADHVRPGTLQASTSEKLFYALMFALPLVGWGMLSAGHYPIVMFGPLHLPPILPANPMLYAVCEKRTPSSVSSILNVSRPSKRGIVPHANRS